MSETTPQDVGRAAGWKRQWRSIAALDQAAWPAIGAAMAGALALILWLGRDTTFSIDELVWFSTTPGMDVGDAVSPHGGHLILTSRLLYAGVLEIFGADYDVFRLLAGGAVLLTSFLFFMYASRRVGKVIALAPTLVLLVFGSDYLHVLVGNAFTVLFAISCGIAALLALERADRIGDLWACGLLCLGVATYTVALAFVVGVAAIVLLSHDRWRRIWIVGVPIALYACWWLWASGQAESSDDQLAFSNVLLIPSWIYQALTAVLGAISGLDFEFSSEVAASAQAGSILALAMVVAVGWRLARGRVPAALWGVLGTAVSLWAMQAIFPTVFREPDTARFLYPGAVVVLLLLAELGRDIRWSRKGLVAVWAVATVGVATNVIELRDGGREARAYTGAARTELGALELAADRTDPAFNPSESISSLSLSLPFQQLENQGAMPAGDYLNAVSVYGSLGYSPEEIGALSETAKARADAVLASALDATLAPMERVPRALECSRLTGGSGTEISFQLPEEGATLLSNEATGPVEIRRFASSTGVPLGTLSAGQPVTLRIPPDDAPGNWLVTVPAVSIRACASR